jgi:hypothetical protein
LGRADEAQDEFSGGRYPPGWDGSAYFKQKLLRMGVVDYWRTHGFPPQCKAAGADDFVCT